MQNAIDSFVKPGVMSDHSAVIIQFNFSTGERGPGYWKLNTSLLNDPHYVDLVHKTISKTVEIEKELNNPILLWETIKCNIRGETIAYATYKKKKT